MYTLTFFFMVALAGAGPFGPRPPNVSHQTPALDSEILQAIRQFRSGSRFVRPGGACEKVLMDSSRDIGRAMSQDEIASVIDDIVLETGEALEVMAAPFPTPRSGRSWCFVGATKVRTPSGEKRMEDLREGEEITSVDLRTGKIVRNRIQKITRIENQTFGRLTGLPRPIDVTSGHRFLTGAARAEEDYLPIGNIKPSANLFAVDADARPAQRLRPIPRGQFVCPFGQATVFDLTLIGEPRNFIAEDILVHNIKVIE